MMSQLDALIAAVNGKLVPLLDIRQFIHIQRPHSSQLTLTTLTFRSNTMSHKHNIWDNPEIIKIPNRYSSCCSKNVIAISGKGFGLPWPGIAFWVDAYHARCSSCGRFCIACYEAKANPSVINAN